VRHAAPICAPGVASRLNARRGCWLGLAVLGLFWALATPGMQAQSSQLSDYDVKAAYLFNFGRFIDWPANGDAAKSSFFAICILGRDPFGPNLDRMLSGQTVNGKKITVKRISSPHESEGCQVLFLSAEEAGQLKQIIAALDDHAVLTVSDMPQFSQQGGMIQFVLEQNRVRFEVNLTAAQRVGLAPSSELLKVATVVRREGRSGD
jgi:YfiR/HmsC-like